MAEKRIMKLATRGKRFAAGVIDSAPLAFVYLSIMGVALSAFAGLVQSVMNELTIDGSDGYYNSHPYVHSESFFHPSVFLILILIYVGAELYFFSRSQTIGKAILGLQVVDAKTGRPIGFAKMLLREVIVKKASSSVLYLGYIWILIDKYNRGWHDKILDTYVIDQRPEKTHVEYVGTAMTGYDDSTNQRASEESVSQSESAEPENPIHEVKADVPIANPFEETSSTAEDNTVEVYEKSEEEETDFEVVNTEEREYTPVESVEPEGPETSESSEDTENPKVLNPREQLLQNLEKSAEQNTDME